MTSVSFLGLSLAEQLPFKDTNRFGKSFGMPETSRNLLDSFLQI
jgi:hypothetical protein